MASLQEALPRQAEEEGLTLQPSDNRTGFKGVAVVSDISRPYQAKVSRGCKQESLGYFATVEEAALCYARDIAVNGAPGPNFGVSRAAAPAPLMAQEALRQAGAEGLTLQPSDNAAGFKGVSFNSGKSKPYQAHVKRGGKAVHLGYFATAEEAALCYVRELAAKGAPESHGGARTLASAPPTAEERLRQAEAEEVGLQGMLPLQQSVTGMPGVPVGFAIVRKGLVSDLCEIIEQQSKQIAEQSKHLKELRAHAAAMEGPAHGDAKRRRVQLGSGLSLAGLGLCSV